MMYNKVNFKNHLNRAALRQSLHEIANIVFGKYAY